LLARAGTLAQKPYTKAERKTDKIGDIPDSSLAVDWTNLCHQIRQDLLQSPETTLANLDGMRCKLHNTGNARMFITARARRS
jgi:hypothetical protein